MLALGLFGVVRGLGPLGRSGTNGRIAYERFTHIGQPTLFQIHTVNADGTDDIQVASISPSKYPSWSPDGTKIAFARNNLLMTTDPEGGNEHTILAWPNLVGPMDWSPDGTRLAVSLQTSARTTSVDTTSTSSTRTDPA